MKLYKKNLFTLVEIMLVSVIGLMTIIMIVSLVMQVTATYQDASADAYLTEQGRLLRTKILRGIDDTTPGLRSAEWSATNSNILAETIETYESMANDVATKNQLLTPSSTIRVAEFKIEDSLQGPDTILNYEREGEDPIKHIKITVLLQLNSGRKTYYKEQIINTVIRNKSN